MSLKTIWIYGVGGVGGVIGGKMAHALTREKIYFIARGKHLEAIQKQGLTLISNQETLLCRPDGATDRPETLPVPDLVIFCVKGYDLESAAKTLKPLIQPHTLILPLLNGVDIDQRLEKILPETLILPACVYVSAFISEPGTVVESSPSEKIVTGPSPRHPDFQPQPLLDLMKKSGVTLQWQPQIYEAIWSKYLLIASFALVTAAFQKTFGQIFEDPALEETVRHVMLEILVVANKKGIDLPQELMETTLQNTRSLPYDAKTSFQRDFEIPDKPNEKELFGQTLLRLGKEAGITLPVTEELVKKLGS